MDSWLSSPIRGFLATILPLFLTTAHPRWRFVVNQVQSHDQNGVKLTQLADSMREQGADVFKDIRVGTWREDWPDKREPAVSAIRALDLGISGLEAKLK